jgi:hypothetical protein
MKSPLLSEIGDHLAAYKVATAYVSHALRYGAHPVDVMQFQADQRDARQALGDLLIAALVNGMIEIAEPSPASIMRQEMEALNRKMEENR